MTQNEYNSLTDQCHELLRDRDIIVVFRRQPRYEQGVCFLMAPENNQSTPLRSKWYTVSEPQFDLKGLLAQIVRYIGEGTWVS